MLTMVTIETRRREPHLDILFLNAGIMFPPPSQLTAQGYDATVGVNVVGHHLFLRLLYPLLVPLSSASQAGPARIIWVSSCANYLVPGRLDFSTFTDGPARQTATRDQKLDTFAMYCQSKLAQIQASALVARRAAEADEAVVSIAVDPGHIRSDIFRGTSSFFFKLWVCGTRTSSPFFGASLAVESFRKNAADRGWFRFSFVGQARGVPRLVRRAHPALRRHLARGARV